MEQLLLEAVRGRVEEEAAVLVPQPGQPFGELADHVLARVGGKLRPERDLRGMGEDELQGLAVVGKRQAADEDRKAVGRESGPGMVVVGEHFPLEETGVLGLRTGVMDKKEKISANNKTSRLSTKFPDAAVTGFPWPSALTAVFLLVTV